MSKVDLHLHTTASDGSLTPEQMVKRAVEVGLEIIAITDHDTVAGIEPAMAAARSYPGLTLIPGVEINTDVPQGEVHVLGYFVDYHHPEFASKLETLRRSREERAQKMIARLAGLGIPIEWRRVRELAAGESVGRPHIAQAMLEKRYIGTLKEAFTKYIGRDGPAYVERYKLTPDEAVTLVVRASGLPVLAHPAGIDGLETLVPRLKRQGLIGLEVYYPGYTSEMVAELSQLARRNSLLTTGGSDYHAAGLATDVELGLIDVPRESAVQLIALAQRRQQETRAT
ncbi:MAG: PHP domain-containing protein [Chloroflexi bacterium]|nr:PHP domain-containing protein [Chloroflexota bacterium]